MIRIETDRTEKGVGTVRNFVTAATDDCFALELLHPMAVRYYLLSLKLEMHMSHQIGWLGAMMTNCYCFLQHCLKNYCSVLLFESKNMKNCVN